MRPAVTKRIEGTFRKSAGLNLPFSHQINNNSCGAAVVEMLYKYHGLEDISQAEIFEKYKRSNPAAPDNFYILAVDLVRDAKARGFNRSKWQKLENLDNAVLVTDILKQCLDEGTPVIVCQQFTESMPHIGHFRIIYRVRRNRVYFHDPHPKYGGENMCWPIQKFIDFWRPSSQNVTGGVYIKIQK